MCNCAPYPALSRDQEKVVRAGGQASSVRPPSFEGLYILPRALIVLIIITTLIRGLSTPNGNQ